MANNRYIKMIQNHVVIILDASTSMSGREAEVIKTVDNQIKYLARRSQEMNQETRVTIYVFSDFNNIHCVIFEMDVLRLPSIAELYKVGGNTALIATANLAIDDLRLTMTKYGNHAFLMFVWTDGEENDSHRLMGYSGFSTRQNLATDLRQKIESLPDNWTVAALVPNQNGKIAAIDCGFPKGNVSVWDVSAADGVEEAMGEIQAATDSYMSMRASGISGTKQLFSTDASRVNKATIQAAKLAPLAPGTYDLVAVTKIKPGEGTLNKDKKPCWEIKAFVEHNGLKFVLGRNFYRMNKQEIVAGDKELAIRERATNRVFVGAGVRAMIGLSDQRQRVAADKNPDYDIFVQSKSNNRYLFQGDELLVIK